MQSTISLRRMNPMSGRYTVFVCIFRRFVTDCLVLSFQIFQSGLVWQRLLCSDEDVSNWLMFVQPARSNREQNLVAYQHGEDIYFVCRRKICAGDELRYWFSSDYAVLLGQTPHFFIKRLLRYPHCMLCRTRIWTHHLLSQECLSALIP